MKKILFSLLTSMVLSLGLQAQSGMQFDHSPTWKAVLDRAKAENKYIFMDAFTTWCGPCKAMAKNIFPLPEVGEFFNDKFINLKVQLDTSKADNDFIKSWYADAHKIMVDYKVRVFPTYLFFSPDGKLVHRAVGSSAAAEFIAKAQDALNPEKQYYTLARRYEGGENSPTLVRQLALSAQAAYDQPAAIKYSKEYLATQTNLLSTENMEFLATFTRASTDPGFSLMLKNMDVFDQVLGAGKAKDQIRNIVMREELTPIFRQENPDFATLQTSIDTKYPGYGEEISLRGQMMFYQQKKNWTAFSGAVNTFLQKFENNISAAELNSFAWRVFENCPDMACVNDAITWSKKSVDQTNDPMFMDTYANLLYKSGKKKEAIEWQKKAIAAVTEKKEDAGELQQTLKRMEGGEKTWN